MKVYSPMDWILWPWKLAYCEIIILTCRRQGEAFGDPWSEYHTGGFLRPGPRPRSACRLERMSKAHTLKKGKLKSPNTLIFHVLSSFIVMAIIVSSYHFTFHLKLFSKIDTLWIFFKYPKNSPSSEKCIGVKTVNHCVCFTDHEIKISPNSPFWFFAK